MSESENKCDKCKLAIRGETGIRCVGVCAKVYHSAAKCSGLDSYKATVIGTHPMVNFICEECITYIHNIDLVLRDMQESVNRNSGYLKEYKNEFEEALKTNQKEMRALMKTMEEKYNERLATLKMHQEMYIKNAAEIKKVREIAEKIKNQAEVVGRENEKFCSEIKTIVKEKNDGIPQQTYANILRTGENKNTARAVPELKKRAPIIVKPKAKQTSERTRQDLNNKINPNELKITDIKAGHNGIMVIDSINEDERNKIKQIMDKKISDEYEIKIPRDYKPKLFITGMQFEKNRDYLIECLRKQNKCLEQGEIKIIKQYNVKTSNKNYYNAILEVDEEMFTNAIKLDKLNVGWERCKVYDGVDVTTCFKCRGYNHKATECKNEEVCTKCLGKHKTIECNEQPANKCINCIKQRTSDALISPPQFNEIPLKKIRYKERLQTRHNELKCIYLNINSIVSNKCELEVLAEVHTPSIILCSETCTTKDVEDSELEIASYNMVRCDSHSRHTGGVLVYVHRTVEINVIYNASVNMNLWCIIIKLKKVDKKWQIGVLYHSPSTSDAAFIEYLNEILIDKFERSKCNILIGDFNINMNYISTYSTKLNEIFSVMDHETIMFNIKTSKSYQMRMTKKITAWDKYNSEILISILRSCNFNINENLLIDEKVELVNNIIMQAMESLTYEKEVHIKLMNKWYDRELAQMNKCKYNNYKLAIQTGDWNEYKNINRIYKKLVKIKKVKYMENKVEMNENNAREMWKHLKQAVCLTRDNEGIKKAIIDGMMVENETELANGLNRFFINSVIEINNIIEPCRIALSDVQINSRLKFAKITTDEVINILKEFKYKIGGRKLISDGVLKDCISYTGYFYAQIINNSIYFITKLEIESSITNRQHTNIDLVTIG
ncbi:repetitive organellar protein-like [Eurosta solidaginis]|uniref:repetitive organellar protein-like n=1 Tax=Eurosta solidaginis TaxID=178769 RepID=UPI003530CE7B